MTTPNNYLKAICVRPLTDADLAVDAQAAAAGEILGERFRSAVVRTESLHDEVPGTVEAAVQRLAMFVRAQPEGTNVAISAWRPTRYVCARVRAVLRRDCARIGFFA